MLVIGLGNEHRGDDGVGVWVAERIAEAGWEGVAAVALRSCEATALFSAWQGWETVYVIDAVDGQMPSGTVVRIDLEGRPGPAGLSSFSSHSLGLFEAIDLGRVLDMLPRQLIVYGIVGQRFEHGSGLSADVARAAIGLVDRLYSLAVGPS